MDINTTLAEREKTHGLYRVHADLTQQIKTIVRGEARNELSASQLEALDMIAHKIGRILAGNPNVHDHWHDIAGYATLVANELTQQSKEKT